MWFLQYVTCIWSMYIECRLNIQLCFLLFSINICIFPDYSFLVSIDLNASQYSIEHINHSLLNYSLIAQHLESACLFHSSKWCAMKIIVHTAFFYMFSVISWG